MAERRPLTVHPLPYPPQGSRYLPAGLGVGTGSADQGGSRERCTSRGCTPRV